MKILSSQFRLRASVLLPTLLLSSTACHADDFFGKTVSYLGSGDSRPCVFFTLANVPTATPQLPGVPWFVLPKTHPQFNQAVAMLMTAKLTGQQINISTSGQVDPCGHAQVVSVGLP